MSLPHRIAAGAVVIDDNRILLVRYRREDGSTFLVTPGGALEEHENIADAAVRECLEETGVRVTPRKVIGIEDLIFKAFKCCKIWMLCDLVSGEPHPTDGAAREGIIESGWFHRDRLRHETLFPPFLTTTDWSAFAADDWQVLCLPSRVTGI